MDETITIQIKKDTYEFLKEFMERINTQDNRCTATPFYYQIQETKTELCCTCGNYDEEVWVDKEYSVVADTTEELKKHVLDSHFRADDDAGRKEIEDMDETAFENWAEDHDYKQVGQKEVVSYKGFFFTEEACKNHIALNGYHYEKPMSYVNHSWRDPEFLNLMKALGELSGKGYTEH